MIFSKFDTILQSRFADENFDEAKKLKFWRNWHKKFAPKTNFWKKI
jgi:hypothetical protein